MELERIWILLARRISDEISAQELQELAALINANPELSYSIDVLVNLVETRPRQGDPKIAILR